MIAIVQIAVPVGIVLGYLMTSLFMQNGLEVSLIIKTIVETKLYLAILYCAWSNNNSIFPP